MKTLLMSSYFIIYKARNLLTNEVYIGATAKSIANRKSDHEQKAQSESEIYFHQSIATYGSDAFVWSKIDTASDLNELAQKEEQYIAKYNSLKEGYNSDRGGGFQKKVYQYHMDTGELLSEYGNLQSAANAVSAATTSISNACLGYIKSAKGYYWSYKDLERYDCISDKRKKKVLKFSPDGILLNEYGSVSDASRKTGISRTCIARCCRGERKQSGGFLWEYS